MTLLLTLGSALLLLRYALRLSRYFRNWPTGSPDYGYGEVDIDDIRQMEAR